MLFFLLTFLTADLGKHTLNKHSGFQSLILSIYLGVFKKNQNKGTPCQTKSRIQQDPCPSSHEAQWLKSPCFFSEVLDPRLLCSMSSLHRIRRQERRSSRAPAVFLVAVFFFVGCVACFGICTEKKPKEL